MEKGHFGVTLNLTNQKVHFTGVSRDNQDKPVNFDYVPPHGDGDGFKGLELLLMSFSGCVSTGIVFLLRRMGKNILAYKMNAIGIRNDQPLCLKKICFEIIIESNDITDEDIQAVLKQAGEISPVWLTLKNSVEVEAEYKIVAS